MENTLRSEELILKKIMYYFRLNPLIKLLGREMARFVLWEKQPEHVGLTDEEKITAFRKERSGSSNEADEINFPVAAAWASLIVAGRKTLRDLIPEKRTLGPIDYERVKIEGIWEDDPPELKQWFLLYEAKRKERDKWDPPIPDKILRKLGRLADSKKFDQIQEELTRIIESWIKKHSPQELSELLRPDKKREEELKVMAKPLKEGGLEIPFPEKYPFGVYFLTVNILAKLYRTNQEIMDAIFTRVSKLHKKAKEGKELSSEEREIYSGQYNTYYDLIERLSQITAKKIGNLEWYINASLANWFRREKWRTRESKEEIPLTDLSQEEDFETHQRKLDHIISQSIYFQEYSHYPDEKILAEEREKELECVRLDLKKEFRSLPLRQKNLALLETFETLTQEEEATKLGCNVRTVKRDLKELRSNPRLQRLLKEDKDLRSE